MNAEKLSKWCSALSMLLAVCGCRLGYERLDIDEADSSSEFGANGNSVGGSGGDIASSSGTGLEGGAPGDTADSGTAASRMTGTPMTTKTALR